MTTLSTTSEGDGENPFTIHYLPFTVFSRSGRQTIVPLDALEQIEV
jgi:hypothetical protein